MKKSILQDNILDEDRITETEWNEIYQLLPKDLLGEFNINSNEDLQNFIFQAELKEIVEVDKKTKKVGYHESGIISEDDTEQSIETTGLKPCVGVVLEAINIDGKKVACLLHFAPQFLNHDTEVQKMHLEITDELLQEGLNQMKKAGVNTDDLSNFRAIVSGESDYKGKQWENMTPAERNAHNVIKVLNERGIKNIEENYNPELGYRTLNYNIKTGKCEIKADNQKDGAGENPVSEINPGDVIDIGATGLNKEKVMD